MTYLRSIIPAVLICLTFFTGCDPVKKDDSTTTLAATPISHSDTTSVPQKVSMVISSIPFPTNIFDSLHYVHAQYQNTIANPVDNLSKYSQSNAEAINLGIYGADLSYVISFEQFQQVGGYMKATKYLADKAGVPMAFTQDVIERCQKNSNNKDSLTKLVFGSYVIIDRALKSDQRKATEVLVLAGGWIEGLYITTQSLQTLSAVTDRQGGYNVLIDQKKYLDILLNQLDLISDSPYCQDISTGLHEIRGVFNNIDGNTINNMVIQNLAEKSGALRTKIISGSNTK